MLLKCCRVFCHSYDSLNSSWKYCQHLKWMRCNVSSWGNDIYSVFNSMMRCSSLKCITFSMNSTISASAVEIKSKIWKQSSRGKLDWRQSSYNFQRSQKGCLKTSCNAKFILLQKWKTHLYAEPISRIKIVLKLTKKIIFYVQPQPSVCLDKRNWNLYIKLLYKDWKMF